MKRSIGAQPGNNNSGKGRVATQALNKAMALRSGAEPTPMTEGYSILVELWDKQIDMAREGNNGSMQMIVERLEGKAAQSIEIDANLTVKEIHDLTDSELNSIAQGGSD